MSLLGINHAQINNENHFVWRHNLVRKLPYLLPVCLVYHKKFVLRLLGLTDGETICPHMAERKDYG